MNTLFQPHISVQKKHKKQKRQERLIVTISSFTNPKSNHQKFIEKHSFNLSTEILIPYFYEDFSTLLQKELITETEYYYEVEGNISVLFQQEFLDKYIKNKKGRFYALSNMNPQRTKSKEHLNYSPSSSFAIISYGDENNSLSKLIIHLDKESYEQLGITGHPLPLFRNSSFYYIEVDLSSTAFTPGKKYYERIFNLLSKKLQSSSFYCSWIVSGVSQEILFPNSLLVSSKRNLETTSEFSSEYKIPDISNLTIRSDRRINESNELFLESLYEWIGLYSIRSDLIKQNKVAENSFVNSFDPSDSLSFYSKNIHLASFKWKGFVSPSFIANKINKIRSLISSEKQSKKESQIPFAIIQVHGFSDAPVSWQVNQHQFHSSGENDFTIVALPEDSYWEFVALDCDQFT